MQRANVSKIFRLKWVFSNKIRQSVQWPKWGKHWSNNYFSEGNSAAKPKQNILDIPYFKARVFANSSQLLTSEVKADCAGEGRGTVGVAVARSASIKGVGGFLGSEEGDGQLED